MNKCKEKLIHLDEYLKSKHHISLAQALEKDAEEIEKVLKGEEEPSEKLIKDASDFFFLDPFILTDDEKELPHDESLQFDELVLHSRKGEYVTSVGKKKNKNVIKRNYGLLTQKKKKSLWINTFLTCAPFLAFVLYSIITVSISTSETLESYKTGDSLSSSQQAIEDSLPLNGQDGVKHYASVKVGTELENIRDISTSSGTYTATMLTRFDFDQMDYHQMWWEATKGTKFNADNFYSDEELSQDEWCFDETGNKWLNYSDNIPDVIQFNFVDASNNTVHLYSGSGTSKVYVEPTSVSTLYTEERAAYPGEKSSNVYSDKNDEFSIGNGKISPDTMEYSERGKAYKDSDGNFRFTQALHFNATINKSFDSPRYPLDSVQFHIYIQPTRDTAMIRYIADSSMSGLSTYFSIGGGYRLLNEKNGIKNFNVKLNYYTDTDRNPSSSTFGQNVYKTQFEVTVRANKHGLSVFVNSFLNIIAVAIWLILAFFNQSFNNDDSISMIGTGFFSAISAILLGFSLVSNANIFSLLSVVNIFTLGMVLVMGYESISAKRANKIGDATLIAYRKVKMRILFYFLLGCAVTMYLVLPAVSYLWMF